jgi:hypothetical protein
MMPTGWTPPVPDQTWRSVRLLTSTPEGRRDYVEADLHGPEKILRKASRTPDFSQAVALILLAIVQFITDDQQAEAVVKRRAVRQLPGGLPRHQRGQHRDHDAHLAHWIAHGTPKFRYRTREQISRYLDGLELLEPGAVFLPFWRPAPGDQPAPMDGVCAAGRSHNAGRPSVRTFGSWPEGVWVRTCWLACDGCRHRGRAWGGWPCRRPAVGRSD